MFAGLGERPWFYFVHSLHGVPDDPALVVAHVRLRRPGQRRLPPRQRVRHAVPPGEVGRCRARPARQLRRGVSRWPPDHAAVPLDRPPRRQGRPAGPGRLRSGDGLRRRRRGAWPSRSAPRAPRGSTSSTSTPPAPATRPTARSSRRSSPPSPGGPGADRRRRAHDRRRRGAGRRRRRPRRDGLGRRRRARAGRTGGDGRAGGRRARPPRRPAGRPRLDRDRRRDARRTPSTGSRRPPRSSSPTSPATGCSAAPTSTGWRRPWRRPTPVIASGGVASLDDVRALAAIAGLHGVITGRALYEGRFTVAEAVGVLAEAGPA